MLWNQPCLHQSYARRIELNMVDHNEIYRTQGKNYHRMISFEDVDNNLRPAMENVASFAGKHILDLGSGTGRIPLLFQNTNMTALEFNGSMLIEQKKQRDALQGQWNILQGDMRFLPFQSNSFDIVTAGWAISNFPGKYGETWESETRKVLEEIHRMVRKYGALIIIETMTTGSLTPAPPNEKLAIYYNWLEKEWGFTKQVIQTDYQFNTLEEAVELGGFFFGEALAKKIRENNWIRLPEWTVVFRKTV